MHQGGLTAELLQKPIEGMSSSCGARMASSWAAQNVGEVEPFLDELRRIGGMVRKLR